MADGDGDSVEQRQARWWADWFAADYSWDGLARHAIQGGGLHGETTLQDYWRRDPATGVARTDAAMREAGELETFDGRLWHLSHLPSRGRDGTTTSWKAEKASPDWARLNALVQARVAMGAETPGRFWPLEDDGWGWRPDGPDGRARLDGAVLGPAPNHPEGEASPLHLCCRQAAFLHPAAFGKAAFGPGVEFIRATFSGDARFNRATFSGDAGFYSATFSGDAGFYSATFSGVARFNRATFSGDADFNSATFSGVARFYSATFSGVARFNSATFSGVARFYSATFSGDARFDSATFKGPATFSGAFKAAGSFRDAVFEKAARFSAAVRRPERRFAGAFHGARFVDIADFSGAVGEAAAGRLAAAFAEAQFEKALILTDASYPLVEGYLRRSLLAGARAAARIDLAADRRKGKDDGRPPLSPSERKTALAGHRRRRLAQLESGCRTVKVAMGKSRDEVREQRYYRFQLAARQRRDDIDPWEKAFGGLYALVSDFGSSLMRPLAALALLTFLCGLGYWSWATTLGVAGPDGFVHGQGMALGAVFRPFALLAPELGAPPGPEVVISGAGPPVRPPPPLSWPATLMAVDPLVALLVRLASALQSILSGVLIFLFALAVRRRFQIS